MRKIIRMRRLGILMILAVLVFLLSAGNAGAWILSEFYQSGTDYGGDYTAFWYRMENNSFDDVIGFAVGLNSGYSEYYETVISAPMGTDSPVGDWGDNTCIVDGYFWDNVLVFDTGGDNITIGTFFGYSWGDFFGKYGYEYAYVALPDALDGYLQGSLSYPDGWIPAGTTYGNGGDNFDPDTDFGFRFYGAMDSASPVIARFGKGSVITGETNTANANPVPIPGAIWLLGPGLLGLVAVRKRKG